MWLTGLQVGAGSLGKMAKSCMKSTKSEFLGQNSSGQANLYTMVAELIA